MKSQPTHKNGLLIASIPFLLAGECVFVPRPGGTAEDDGVILCQHMGAEGLSSLVIIDAHSWEEVGRARLPYGLPCE